MQCHNKYILLKLIKEQEVTSSILHIPDLKSDSTKAEVLESDDVELSKGDIIFIETKHLLNGRFKDPDIKVCKSSDILCILEN